MSERDQQQTGSPLQSERGSTTVGSGVVSRIAGIAAGEIDGLYAGGASGGFFGRSSDPEDLSKSISVKVGSVEAAIDMKVGMRYGKNIGQLAGEIQEKITDRVQTMTGLRIKELNVTITDIIFPQQESEQPRTRRRVR